MKQFTTPSETRFSAPTQWLRSSLLLLVGLVFSVAIFAQATVTTDKPDYAPRSNAVFTGAGFQPYEQVQLKVKNLFRACNTVTSDSSYLPWTVTADANGGFVTDWTVCDCAGDSLRLKATGLSSGLIAYAFFTDGNVNLTTSGLPSGSTSVNVIYRYYTNGSNISGPLSGVTDFSVAVSNNKEIFFSYPSTVTVTGGNVYSLTNVTASAGTISSSTQLGYDYEFSSPNATRTITGVYQLSCAVPTVVCPLNQTINPSLGLCKAQATYTPTINGTSPTITYSFTGATLGSGTGTGSGSLFNKGVTTVSITAANNCGSESCSFTVTVVDNQQPVVTCPVSVNATKNADLGLCTYKVNGTEFNASATDNCAVTSLTYTLSGATSGSGSSLTDVVLNKGVTTVTWTATDGVTTPSTCSFTVTVNDMEAPVADVATLPTVTGECSATVSAPTATDNCEGTITGTTSDPTSYTTQGTYTITWTYDDGNGNTSSQTQTVVVDDVTAPVPDVATLPTVTGECSATVSAPTATDNCEGTITGTTSDPTSYTTQGTYTITWTYDDGNGNTSSQTQTVVVDDVTAPVPDVATLPTVTGECSATVSAPTATDNCEGTITGTTSDPTSYTTQGTYTITWTYDDGNGNTSSQTQTVVVDDVTAPVADVATLPTVTGECSATVSAPTATDNCEGTITGTTSDPTSYSAQGTYTITWTYDDGNGNTSSQTQTVVVDDVTKPVPDVASLPTVTGECSATVTAPTATDNCEGTITGTTTDPTSYSAQGTYTITWTYDDGNGNVETQTQTVVVDDVTKPVPDVTTLPTVTGECSATVSAPTATDNCEGTITGTTSDPTSYSAQGTYTITWTYDDGNGNTSSQTQTVVVDDVTAPVADVASLPTVTGECSATVSAPTATDNCEGTITGTTSDPTSYTTQGTYTITWTYDDGNGNTSSQTQTVVVDDVTAPVPDVATLPTVTGECSATVSAPTATDNCEGTITGTTSDPTSYTTQGTYTITWTYDDGNGNTSSQTQTVVVDDVTAPVPDVATLPTVTGECSATVSAPTATDNCEGTITGTTSDPTSYTTQGTYTITWTYDDGNGNTSSQTQTVVVDDVTAPVPDVATLPTVTGECSATVSAPTATDNCEGTITGTTSDPTSYTTQGTYTITWTYDDGNGNTSSQTQTVVVDDVTAPVPDVATLPTVTGECSATVSAPTATDNCEGTITGTTSDPTSYSAQGTYTITWTYDDGNGNASSQTQTVVVDDVTAPVPDVATLPTVTGECSATVSAPTATDNCEGTITGTTSDPTSYTTQGTYTITWTYDDGNGNASSQTQTVVVDDVTAPVPDVATLPTVTGECSATVSAPTATDNCEGTITGTTSDPTSYTTQGTYTITWTYDDGNGNASSQTQTVVVDDVTAPVADVATLPTVTGECSATVSAPTATDNCEGTITGTTSDPTSYSAQGTYTITWTYDDGNGNTSSQTQTVVVDDVTAPVPDVATLPTVTGECSATVTAPTATDNCEGTITGTTTDPTSYSAQGTYTITWTYDDGNGNTSSQTQTVVVDDVTKPVPDVASLPTVTGECSATITAPTATDNCEGTITGTTTDPTSYSAQGTYTITWTYDDGNGNVETQTQTVVVDDVTKPVPDVTTLPTVTGECSATVSAPTATDNCEGTITGTTSDPTSYSAQGTYTITWTYDDGNGNTSSQTQTVVVDDVTAPVADVASLPTVTGECSATVSAPTATDNCEGTITGTTSDPTSYTTQGTYTITWTYDDGNGNTSSQTQTVVVDDVTAPTIVCPGNIDLPACGDGIATWSTPTGSDNCSGFTVSQTSGPVSGTSFAPGTTTTIGYKVTDVGGNTATCSFTVKRAATLAVTCSNSNPVLYFGYAADQTTIITGTPTGGTAPYSIKITMNRPLMCNVVNASGDEIWSTSGGTGTNTICPGTGSLTVVPVSELTNVVSGGSYLLNATLMANAVITITVTDANGCTATCSTNVYAEDVRCFAGNSGKAKIAICHQTGSSKNPCNEVCVDESALSSHLAHGDWIGKCNATCTAPTPIAASTSTTVPNEELSKVESLSISVMNNPAISSTPFKLKLLSNNTKDLIELRVMDVNGKPVELKHGIHAGQTIEVGRAYLGGLYFAEATQNGKRVVVKLLKQ